MKDIVHHLKHLQKKVINSSRKVDSENHSTNTPIAPAMPTEVAAIHKKKAFDAQLRKSSVRLHVH